MSKQIDASKLERIQEAAITLISRNGVANASVALIARQAGVSTGYLYRHYLSKEELMNDLLDRLLTRIGDRIAWLASGMNTLEESVQGMVRYIFETAAERPDHIRFCLNLQNDLSCPISERVLDRLKGLCEEIRRQGQTLRVISPEVTAEDIYIILMALPLQYVGVRLRGVFGAFENNEAEICRVSALCMSAIKNR